MSHYTHTVFCNPFILGHQLFLQITLDEQDIRNNKQLHICKLKLPCQQWNKIDTFISSTLTYALEPAMDETQIVDLRPVH